MRLSASLLFLATLPAALCWVCKPRGEYWNANKGECTPCKKCTGNDIVLKPCHVDKDTICGPLSKLNFDWSWMKQGSKTTEEPLPVPAMIQHHFNDTRNHHNGAKHHHNNTKNHHDRARNPHHNKHHNHHHKRKDLPCAKLNELLAEGQLKDDAKPSNNSARFGFLNCKETTTPEPLSDIARFNETANAPFSTMEVFVWDWQSAVLIVGTFACMLFLVLVATFSMYQARQWKRLKNYDPDLEEVTARTALFPEEQAMAGSEFPGFYSSNQCLYMKQLLDLKKQNQGESVTKNVYVEEAPSSPLPSNRMEEARNIVEVHKT